MASIAIIGEINLDLIVTGAPRLPRPGEELIVDDMLLTLGASSALIASQLARLGDDVVFVSKVGDDEFGRRALQFLDEVRVPTEHVTVLPERRSGLTISISLGEERALITQLGTIQEMTHADMDWHLIRLCQHLHISSYYLQRKLQPDLPRIFQQAKELGMTTSLDTGYPSDENGVGSVAETFEHLDIFLPNEVEAKLIAGRDTVEEALDVLAKRIPLVVVKLGAEGATARREHATVHSPAFAVEVVDTTGAGDSFNGGFLHAYLTGATLEECLDLGMACGALSTQAVGGSASQPTLEEAREFIQSAPRRE